MTTKLFSSYILCRCDVLGKNFIELNRRNGKLRRDVSTQTILSFTHISTAVALDAGHLAGLRSH